MKDYPEVLHEHIRSLFDDSEVKIEIKMITDAQGNFDRDASVAIRVTHLPSGKEAVCDSYDSQVKNANIAFLALRKKVDDTKKGN